MKKSKKEQFISSGICILCKRPDKLSENIFSERDFVCSLCVLYLVEHPRIKGDRFEDILKKVEVGEGYLKLS